MKLLKLLGDLFIVALIAVSLLGSCSPKAAQPDVPRADERKAGEIRAGGSMEAKPAQSVTYELVLAIYSAAKGHELSWRSYRDIIHIRGYKSYEACTEAGYAAQSSFKPQHDSDYTADLLDFVCLKVTA